MTAYVTTIERGRKQWHILLLFEHGWYWYQLHIQYLLRIQYRIRVQYQLPIHRIHPATIDENKEQTRVECGYTQTGRDRNVRDSE